MNTDMMHAAWLAVSFLGLFAMAELLYHRFHIEAEYTRKLVHLGTGLLTFLFPVFLHSHWWVLFLCSSFALILLASFKFNLLKSINAVDRITWGSLCYPVAVYTCFLVFEFNARQDLFFYLPILILAVCDPLAALAGRRWPVGKYSVLGNNKSFLGSLVFVITAFCISFFFLSNDIEGTGRVIVFSLIISIVSAIAEAWSNKGFDNLTIPFSVLLLCMLIV